MLHVEGGETQGRFCKPLDNKVSPGEGARADGLLHHAAALFTYCSIGIPRGPGRIALGSFVLAMAVRTPGHRGVQLLLDLGDAFSTQQFWALIELDEEEAHARGCRPIFILFRIMPGPALLFVYTRAVVLCEVEQGGRRVGWSYRLISRRMAALNSRQTEGVTCVCVTSTH